MTQGKSMMGSGLPLLPLALSSDASKKPNGDYQPLSAAAAASEGGGGGAAEPVRAAGDAGLATVGRSALPFLAFLMVYGVNGRLAVLPRADDVSRDRLTNISGLERRLFGGVMPGELVAGLSNPVLDLLAAVPYLVHYALPVAFPLFWLATERLGAAFQRSARFYWLLGWTMWAHYVIWFALPTAPPLVVGHWHAPHLNATAAAAAPAGASPPREGCAFARVDRLTGVPLFRTMFANNPVPYASFPSGHVAWPSVALVASVADRCSRRRRAILAAYVAWVGWATLYSCHHYLLDAVVAFAVVCAVHRLLGCFSPPCCSVQRNWKPDLASCFDGLSVVASCSNDDVV